MMYLEIMRRLKKVQQEMDLLMRIPTFPQESMEAHRLIQDLRKVNHALLSLKEFLAQVPEYKEEMRQNYHIAEQEVASEVTKAMEAKIFGEGGSHHGGTEESKRAAKNDKSERRREESPRSSTAETPDPNKQQ